MPELPDVERLRRAFRAHASGRTVERVWADPAVLRNVGPRELQEALRGRTFGEPGRHGKWLIGWTDGPALLLHFGMTGGLVWSGDEPARHRHDRMGIGFVGGGELRYRDQRKLGGVWLAGEPDEVAAHLAALGPDALAVPEPELARRLSRRRGSLKAALLDQTVVAGVGNLVADEALWRARLHPERPVPSLAPEERRRLARALQRVLVGLVERGPGRGWLLAVRDLPGVACPRCRGPLQRTRVAGRTSVFCPRCQPRPGRGPGRMDGPWPAHPTSS
ncbi:MAG TPA: DNA-formamidopyrimidine glycosylase family protein [Actinomycetota bacterium]|nr:DNA-formamidopyrimidine glycosylase family protein [Actinomycetota bacterium]